MAGNTEHLAKIADRMYEDRMDGSVRDEYYRQYCLDALTEAVAGV